MGRDRATSVPVCDRGGSCGRWVPGCGRGTYVPSRARPKGGDFAKSGYILNVLQGSLFSQKQTFPASAGQQTADGDSWIMSSGAKSHFTWFSTYLLTFSPLLGDALQDTPPALSTYLVCRSRNAIPKCFFCLKLQNGFELNFPCEGVLFREG
jgi:hypothetical protein